MVLVAQVSPQLQPGLRPEQEVEQAISREVGDAQSDDFFRFAERVVHNFELPVGEVVQEHNPAVGAEANDVGPSIHVDVSGHCLLEGRAIRMAGHEIARAFREQEHRWRSGGYEEQIGALVVIPSSTRPPFQSCGLSAASRRRARGNAWPVVLHRDRRLTIGEDDHVHVAVAVEVGRHGATAARLRAAAKRSSLRESRRQRRRWLVRFAGRGLADVLEETSPVVGASFGAKCASGLNRFGIQADNQIEIAILIEVEPGGSRDKRP